MINISIAWFSLKWKYIIWLSIFFSSKSYSNFSANSKISISFNFSLLGSCASLSICLFINSWFWKILIYWSCLNSCCWLLSLAISICWVCYLGISLSSSVFYKFISNCYLLWKFLGGILLSKCKWCNKICTIFLPSYICI